MGFSLFAAAAENVSILDPVSPSGESIRHLTLLVMAITGAIFVLVEGILLYSIFRFREKPGAGKEPPQVYGSLPIEIAWTAAPAMVVFVLMLVVARTEWEVRPNPDRPPPGSKPLYVTVIGHQWWWEYVYDKYDGQEFGFITANELHMPASDATVPRPVYLTLKSADVCHSYWVPRLGGKTDLIPGRVNNMWLQTDQPGLYFGQCAEFCGTQHANMLLRVYVDPPAEFDRWAANQKREQKPRKDEPKEVTAGRSVFLGQTCVNCHTIRGLDFKGTRADGTYAPDLTHLASRETIASGMVPNTTENLRRWVKDPRSIKAGCLMPGFALSDRQIDDLVAYLRSLE